MTLMSNLLQNVSSMHFKPCQTYKRNARIDSRTL
eukprot:UN24378